MRILLIESDARLGELVGQVLDAARISCDVYPTVAQGHYAQTRQTYQCAIVDRRCPDGDGIALVRRWRAAGQAMPCLMLGGPDQASDRIDSLEAGADDCLSTPFAPQELLARVRALLRRPPALAQRLHAVGPLVVNTETLTASYAGQPIKLTVREFQVLRVLAEHAGQFMTRPRLHDHVFGHFSDVGSGGLDVTLHRLRRKLRAITLDLAIVNQPNIGYRLVVASDAAASAPWAEIPDDGAAHESH